MQRNKVRQTIGIDINETEICVTQVQGTWPDPQVIKIDSEPIPHNSIKNSEVINADIIAETLRQLIDRMELNTKSAVMSIPSRQVVTRILDIPNVPDPEMKALLDMEVSHQHILREEDGVYAHTNLPTTIKGRDESRQILVMASEESTLSKYREIANKAGIYLIGLEPATVAMARIASITTHARQS
ncbi:MAG: pilus assembly protein PilM, partial [Chthonomonadales bacterium]